jgi:membrane-associated protein
MSALLSGLLTFFETYGYLALWVSVFIAAAGLPLPIYLEMLAAGAFAALGDFNLVLLFVIAFSAQVCGDNVGYLIGRRWGSKVLNWLEQSQKWNRFIPLRTIERSRNYFRQRGGWAIFLSRFLFTALAGIINLLAGSELYPYRYFILTDASGKALGVLIQLLLGFIFAASWEVMGEILGPLSLFILGLLAVFLLVRLLIKYTRELKQAHSAEVSQPLDVQSIPGGAPVVDTPASPSGKLPLL